MNIPPAKYIELRRQVNTIMAIFKNHSPWNPSYVNQRYEKFKQNFKMRSSLKSFVDDHTLIDICDTEMTNKAITKLMVIDPYKVDSTEWEFDTTDLTTSFNLLDIRGTSISGTIEEKETLLALMLGIFVHRTNYLKTIDGIEFIYYGSPLTGNVVGTRPPELDLARPSLNSVFPYHQDLMIDHLWVLLQLNDLAKSIENQRKNRAENYNHTRNIRQVIELSGVSEEGIKLDLTQLNPDNKIGDPTLDTLAYIDKNAYRLAQMTLADGIPKESVEMPIFEIVDGSSPATDDFDGDYITFQVCKSRDRINDIHHLDLSPFTNIYVTGSQDLSLTKARVKMEQAKKRPNVFAKEPEYEIDPKGSTLYSIQWWDDGERSYCCGVPMLVIPNGTTVKVAVENTDDTKPLSLYTTLKEHRRIYDLAQQRNSSEPYYRWNETDQTLSVYDKQLSVPTDALALVLHPAGGEGAVKKPDEEPFVPKTATSIKRRIQPGYARDEAVCAVASKGGNKSKVNYMAHLEDVNAVLVCDNIRTIIERHGPTPVALDLIRLLLKDK